MKPKKSAPTIEPTDTVTGTITIASATDTINEGAAHFKA